MKNKSAIVKMLSRLKNISRPACKRSYQQNRRLWIAASSAEPSLHTAATQCITSIHAALQTHQAETPSDKSHCFVLVSQQYQVSDTERIAKFIKEKLGSIAHSCTILGTVVDGIFSNKQKPATNGISVLFYQDEPNQFSQPFYIGDEHGRQRLREVAVGRWHNQTTDRFIQHQDKISWVQGKSSATQAASHLQLPSELRQIDDPRMVQLIIFASDKETRQVLDALDMRFPNAIKLGIVGAQTPFFNGREFTLFKDHQVYDSGIVGVAFGACDGANQAAIPALAAGVPKVVYGRLKPISGQYRIERCKGNVILELEEGDGAHSLIAALRKARMEHQCHDSDSRLFARITCTQNQQASSGEAAELQSEKVFQVTGGNPAKGGLAVDTLCDLAPGQFIQFMMLADSPSSQTAPMAAMGCQVCFGADSSAEIDHSNSSTQVFGGVSENGFSYGAPLSSKPPYKNLSKSVFVGSTECAVPGSVVTLELK
ncbi:hypothetical protein IWW36_003663 [Coemansia brasiliensis]|uniref:FIST domain-containing protein n=1 Tax=Coemansia brasiliensis TaxID=2650707 RepID=A0A9W8I9R2_9FUNG|nr:hypothetical protein IWW36_003663 [Coemansia brasiliensis]